MSARQVFLKPITDRAFVCFTMSVDFGGSTTKRNEVVMHVAEPLWEKSLGQKETVCLSRDVALKRKVSNACDQ